MEIFELRHFHIHCLWSGFLIHAEHHAHVCNSYFHTSFALSFTYSHTFSFALARIIECIFVTRMLSFTNDNTI